MRKNGPVDVQFILVRPRNPMNIGACARAMANFGFSHLSVVDPYEPIWVEARSAMGGGAVIRNARVRRTLPDALKRCDCVIGTSCGKKRVRPNHWISPATLPRVLTSPPRPKNVAILFGSEKNGLTNQDLNYCHQILRIPTAPDVPSMNLSHAVAVTAFELSRQIRKSPPRESQDGQERIPRQNAERLVQQGVDACEKSGLFRGWDRKRRELNLRRAIYQWKLSKNDVAMLHGIFRWILKKS